MCHLQQVPQRGLRRQGTVWLDNQQVADPRRVLAQAGCGHAARMQLGLQLPKRRQRVVGQPPLWCWQPAPASRQSQRNTGAETSLCKQLYSVAGSFEPAHMPSQSKEVGSIQSIKNAMFHSETYQLTTEAQRSSSVEVLPALPATGNIYRLFVKCHEKCSLAPGGHGTSIVCILLCPFPFRCVCVKQTHR